MYSISMKQTGRADLPLHSGTVPKWLADRMMMLGALIVESLIINFGRDEVLVRLSDPLWFQSFGAVMGMDWHSSGITTSVMYALKRGLNPRAHELGICVCGGRGKYSRKTPDELKYVCGKTGLNGDELIRASKLSAKVDNTAVQDGYQLYQHNFVLSIDGSWAVVQQGMNPAQKAARRYHWCSKNLRSFTEEPHTAVVGENNGEILNLTSKEASPLRSRLVDFAQQEPSVILGEIQKMQNTLPLLNSRDCVMSSHHEVREEDVDTKRLGAVLASAYETHIEDFESLLLTPGLGPRTLQSLTLVSEVLYGTPSRFTDPARFSFAHGGKDGHPFPVPLTIYDESIRVLQESIEKSKLGYTDKSDCIKRLHTTALTIERNCSPDADFEKALKFEREHSREWGGKTV